MAFISYQSLMSNERRDIGVLAELGAAPAALCRDAGNV
jgi:hypothetical protein